MIFTYGWTITDGGACAPVLATISPASVAAGSGDLSPTQLTALIPAASLASVQTAQLTVFTPAPGGGTSSVLAFFVTQAAASVTVQDVASGDDNTASAGPATATASGDGLLVAAQ